MADMSDDDFVRVKALAPYEVADVFAEWSRRCETEAREKAIDPRNQFGPEVAGLCGGLGPPWPFGTHGTHNDFGRRMAVGLFQLLKEV